MLIEKVVSAQTQIQFVPYSGIVNPEHMTQTNYVPIVNVDDNDDKENCLEKVFIEDFIRKSKNFREKERINSIPIEIRLGTVYTYQNRRQQNQYPNSLYYRKISAQSLRNEEYRPHQDKYFLITFNKNKGINDIRTFEHELTCAGFRSISEPQWTYRLYLRFQRRRLILELKRNVNDIRWFSVKRLLKYSTKYSHIDVIKSKQNTNYSETFDDIFDIRTLIGKDEEEELHIHDDYCNFIQIKDLNQCVSEIISNNGNLIYQFNRAFLPYFDYFQIKQTRIYDYSCIDSRFFGVRILIENQIGYDLCSGSKAITPCLQTENVIRAKLLSSDFTGEEAKRILTIGTWLSDLATRCTDRNLPPNKMT